MGDYDFSHMTTDGTHMRGNQPYYRPIGWKRFAINVSGKFDNGDNTWLGSSNNNGEWAVTYHGISFETTNLKPFKGILENGFKIQGGLKSAPQGAAYGTGIYTCPQIESWPSDSTYSTEMKLNNKNYKL